MMMTMLGRGAFLEPERRAAHETTGEAVTALQAIAFRKSRLFILHLRNSVRSVFMSPLRAKHASDCSVWSHNR